MSNWYVGIHKNKIKFAIEPNDNNIGSVTFEKDGIILIKDNIKMGNNDTDEAYEEFIDKYIIEKSVKLKKCPCCGSTPEISKARELSQYESGGISCPQCELGMHFKGATLNGLIDAINRWNSRPINVQKLEKLNKILK